MDFLAIISRANCAEIN